MRHTAMVGLGIDKSYKEREHSVGNRDKYSYEIRVSILRSPSAPASLYPAPRPRCKKT